MTRAGAQFVIVMWAASVTAFTAYADRFGTEPVRIIRPDSLPSGEPTPVITAVRIHPNGRLLATAGDDHFVRLWDLKTGRQLRRLEGHKDWIKALAFSPDGNLLASAGNDYQVILWDVAEGRQSNSIVLPGKAVASIAFNRSGSKIAVVGFNRSTNICQVSTGQVIEELDSPCRDMRCIAFSNDDQLIVGAGRNGRLAVHDVGQRIELALFQAHQQRVRAIAFTRGGQQIITAGEDRTIRIWNRKDFRLEREISTGNSKVMSMVVLNDGRVATGGSDNGVSIWDLSAGTRTQLLKGHTGSVVALDQHNRILVSGSFDTSVRVWRLKSDDVVADRDAFRTR